MKDRVVIDVVEGGNRNWFQAMCRFKVCNLGVHGERWKGTLNVVKTAAEEEARYHRAQHKRAVK